MGSPACRSCHPRRLVLVATALLVGAVGPACDSAAGRAGRSSGGGSSTAAAVSSPAPARTDTLADSVFARLVVELSEPGRYFDTDNLISNEASYLHVLGELEDAGVRGGAYLGVGPDQNFSYIAAVRPALAFMVDIRRDNLLQHLWLKALFDASSSRLDYLCLMVARSCGGPSVELDAEALVERVDRAEPVDAVDSLVAAVVDRAAGYGVPLDARDRETVASIHQRFAADGLDLRFTTHGRGPRPGYPTLRRLVLETDRDGEARSYLASEAAYAVVADLQARNRVIPVVGDLAGETALRAIGRELKRRGLEVTAFYASNVEFYLFDDGRFDAFVDNLRALPTAREAVIVRSYFNRFQPHPRAVPGYLSTQLVQSVEDLFRRSDAGSIPTYRSLVGG
jgi:hypothetical protein